ncbi:hypothetical protein K2173_005523 [Erythroxylum novogranatense]|uniref:Purple acid phosphatase n=1 Tax=Erythroxylum novogranatense TaxID=1862640 RepID=A0AAV8SKR5_9ROSI|nr:hypothetical protein K2173_005523 [Erythroxylum novogranatense]
MASKAWCGSAILLALLFTIVKPSYGGITSKYVRKAQPSIDMPLKDYPPPKGYNAPEQVHITQGDHTGRAIIISWITPVEPTPDTVTYWPAKEPCEKKVAKASTITYKYYTYTSGYIHHATIKELEYDTKYFYEIACDESVRQFHFSTPPAPGPDVPYTFGIIGDLGQTYASKETLSHYISNKNAQAMLFLGDLSYADDYPNHDNVRWDTWGRLVERSVAYQPWIWTPGNHEIDFDQDIGEIEPFKPYNHRCPTPYKASGSTSPLWYSVKRASAYIIVLSSYSAYGKYTPQYQWLEKEFPKVNRSETPWLIILVHSPWYNSNGYHYMEGETMRVQFEKWVVQNKVDLVFAGHVHSYERSFRISNIKYNITNGLSFPVNDSSAPMYFTLGDGGNIEGLAAEFSAPQPEYSAFREASFGHAILDIKNRTHAHFTWHRNQDDKPVAADSTWVFNRYWFAQDETNCKLPA